MASARNGVIAAAVITAAGGVLAAVIAAHNNGGGPGSSTTQVTPAVSLTTPTFPPQTTEPAARVFLNRDSGPGGTQVLVSGQGFGPGEEVIIRFHTDQVGSTTASEQGGFANVAITVPRSFSQFAPQQFEISATGQNTDRSATAPFTISG